MSGAPAWLYAPNGRLRAAWRLAVYVLALVAASAVAQAVVYPIIDGVSRAIGARIIAYPWLLLGAVFAAHAAMLRWIERRPWTDVGLGRDAVRARGLALGAAAGALAIGVPVAALLGIGWLRVVSAPDGDVLGTAASALATLAPAALYEELVVRGYPFMVLRESAGVLPALLVTSVVFGLLHLMNPGATVVSVAMVTLAGVFLGGVLLATGSLWAAFAAHLAWNWTLSGVVHAAVSGLPFATPDYRVIDAGPDLVTGGAWGPEGGLAAGAGMLMAIALLARGRRSNSLTRGALAAGERFDG